MAFITEAYGRYEIKSSPLAGAWGANAIRRRTVVAKAVGSSREEAISRLKNELERLERHDLSERDDEGAPPVRAYEEAFGRLLPNMPESYSAMLRAHFEAPDHLLSATGLAKAAGYSGYGGANLHYGLLGQQVAREIGFEPPRRLDGSAIWTCAIARDPALETEFPDTSMLEAMSRGFDARHFEWQLRHQVVDALKSLWFRRP